MSSYSFIEIALKNSDYLFSIMLSITNVYLFVLGWHHRANAKAGHRSSSLYRLCPLLLQEAQLVETRVSSDNLCQDVRRTTSATQRKFEKWMTSGKSELDTSLACVVPSTCLATKCVQIAIDAISFYLEFVFVMCIVTLMMLMSFTFTEYKFHMESLIKVTPYL